MDATPAAAADTAPGADARPPAPADVAHSDSLPPTPVHPAAPTAIPSSPSVANSAANSDSLVMVPALHLTASSSPPDRAASAIPTPRGPRFPISPVSAHGGAASSRSAGSNGSAHKRRLSLPHGTPSPRAPPWVPAVSSNSAHRIIPSTTYDPAHPSFARMRDASMHLPPAERRVFQPAEGYPPPPVRLFQEDAGPPLEPVAAERFSPRQILAVAAGRRSPGNSGSLQATPQRAAATSPKSNPLPARKRRPLTHRSPDSIRRLSEASTRTSSSSTPKGPPPPRARSSDGGGRGGAHSGPLSILERNASSTPPSARAPGRSRSAQRSSFAAADRWGTRRAVGAPKQAFGRTLEDRGPKRMAPQGVHNQMNARPWGAGTRGGRIPAGPRAVGSRGRAMLSGRRSAAVSVASGSSFHLSRVDEIGEEEHGEEGPAALDAAEAAERVGESASVGASGNPLGPQEAEFASADSRSLAYAASSLQLLQTETSMATATSASLATSSLNAAVARSGALDAAPAAAHAGPVVPAASTPEPSAPLPVVAESSAVSEDDVAGPLAANGAQADDTAGTDTDALGAATALPSAPGVNDAACAPSGHLSEEASSQSLHQRLRGKLSALARQDVGGKSGPKSSGGSGGDTPSVASPIAAEVSHGHSAALSSAMRDGPTVTVSLGVAPGAPTIPEAPAARRGAIDASEPGVGAALQADVARADVSHASSPPHGMPEQPGAAGGGILLSQQGTNKEASNGGVAAVRAASSRGEGGDKAVRGVSD